MKILQVSQSILVLFCLWLWVAEGSWRDDVVCTSFDIDIQIVDNYAKSTLTSTLRNNIPYSSDAEFLFQLPEDAFISDFKFVMEREIALKGEVVGLDEALTRYNEARSRGSGAALVDSRGMNKFGVSVNLPGGVSASYTIIYEQLLSKKMGYYDFVVNIDPIVEIQSASLNALINNSAGLINVEVPTHPDATIQSGVNLAMISYSPSDWRNWGYSTYGSYGHLSSDFHIRYSLMDPTENSGLLLIDPTFSFFVHWLTPPPALTVLPKKIVFVIDISGSMSGEPLSQAKEAFVDVVSNLKPSDQFTILAFSSCIDIWSGLLREGSDDNKELAIGWVNTLEAGGMTNIEQSMTMACEILKGSEEYEGERGDCSPAPKLAPFWESGNIDLEGMKKKRASASVPMVVFLTDGQPTVGETDPEVLRKIVSDSNLDKTTGSFHSSIFCLAFGLTDVTFLMNIASDNGGTNRKIYEDSDAVLQMKGFFNEISTPLLKDIQFTYHPAAFIRSVTTSSKDILFQGGEMLVAGALEDSASSLTAIVTATSSAGVQIPWTQEVNFASLTPDPTVPIERIWAFLTMKEYIYSPLDDIIYGNREEATLIAIKYSFVTPFTAIIATEIALPEPTFTTSSTTSTNSTTAQFSTSSLPSNFSLDSLDMSQVLRIQLSADAHLSIPICWVFMLLLMALPQ